MSVSVIKSLGRAIQCVPRNHNITQCQSCVRFFSDQGRAACVKDNEPRCSPEKLAKKPCDTKKMQELKQSSWYNPDCCNDPCPDAHPRFDDLYYRESDKLRRKYFKTWVECPELRVVPKKICCFEKTELPPIERRKFTRRSKTTCVVSEQASLLMPCKKPKTDGKCPKFKMPGCTRDAQNPPTCRPDRKPLDCKKKCAPYPSFSECILPKFKEKRPTECECLQLLPMCSIV